MSQPYSTPFHEQSISQLVHELNQLGGANVAMQPLTLIAIHQKDHQRVRRFRSKSTSRNETLSKREKQQPQFSQFFLTDGSQKKYYYNEVANDLELLTIGNIMSSFQRGFNVSVLLQENSQRVQEILLKVKPWFEDISGNSALLASFTEYRVKDKIDLFNQERTLPLESSSQVFYEGDVEELAKLLGKSKTQNIKIMKLRNKEEEKAELRLILFPNSFMSATNPNLKVIKNQLVQILSYIKTNPKKRYENINKLLPKRHPLTTILGELILYDSANFIVNWVNDDDNVNSRFQFFDKFSGVSNFIKRVENSSITLAERKKKNSKSFSKPKQQMDVNSTKPLGFDNSRMTELQYCRSLERKTHKYSISEFQSQSELFHQPKSIENNIDIAKCTESEAITILKSQHARQISQYHQTIQNLNKKLLTITTEKGIEEIYTIHEREIMLLQLKIEELRDDISKLCGQKKSGKNDDSNLKAMVKKLNNQVKMHEKVNTSYKLSQGRIKMLEKELTEFREKYRTSELARKQLAHQLQALTKRLKIKDTQTLMKPQEPAKYNDDDLAPKENEQLRVIEDLLSCLGKEKKGYVLRKIKNILGDLSSTREIVLDCNNFLVQLQEHIEQRLSEKDPEVVLDCNRFIRSYLLNNLNIF